MAYPSTMEYYMKINELINLKKGGWNSAHILLYSLDFQEIIDLQTREEWNTIREIILDKARVLENAGCSAIMICSNTMHRIVPEIEDTLSIPILNIVDAVGNNIVSQNLRTVLLLGTKSTMEGTFYRKRLLEKFGINTLIPSQNDRNFINHMIYQELAQNQILSTSKQKLLKILSKMQQKGIEGVIMGCGEIPLILKQEDVPLPLFNSMELHIQTAVNFLLD